MNIADILSDKGTKIHTVSPSITVLDAVRRLADAEVGSLVVCDEGRLCGIVSERDVVRGLAGNGPAVLEERVEKVMTCDVHTCSSQDTVARAMALMTRFRYRHLPVVDCGRLVGIISIGDLVKHRVREMETETCVLRDLVVSRF